MRLKRAGESLDLRDPAFIRSTLPISEWFYRNYFRVRTSGWHHIPNGKVLVVGSHNGGQSSPDLGAFLHNWFKRLVPNVNCMA